MNGISFSDVPVPDDDPYTPDEWWGPWWDHPNRNCKGRYQFTDIDLHPGRGRGHNSEVRRAFIEALKRDCLACPVLVPCRKDLLSSYRDGAHWGVWAGYEGRWS